MKLFPKLIVRTDTTGKKYRFIIHLCKWKRILLQQLSPGQTSGQPQIATRRGKLNGKLITPRNTTSCALQSPEGNGARDRARSPPRPRRRAACSRPRPAPTAPDPRPLTRDGRARQHEHVKSPTRGKSPSQHQF